MVATDAGSDTLLILVPANALVPMLCTAAGTVSAPVRPLLLNAPAWIDVTVAGISIDFRALQSLNE